MPGDFSGPDEVGESAERAAVSDQLEDAGEIQVRGSQSD